MASLVPSSRPLIDVLTSTARTRVSAAVVDGAVVGLDRAVRSPIEDLPSAQRTRLINQFVRGLRGISVRDALELERELLDRSDCAPSPRCEVKTKDGISLIALRTHVRYVAVYAGFDWSEGMMLQSSFSELARLLQESGGAVFRFRATDDFDEISVGVELPQPLPPRARVELEAWKRSLPPFLSCTGESAGTLLLHLALQATAA